jgi:hypothetical protein
MYIVFSIPMLDSHHHSCGVVLHADRISVGGGLGLASTDGSGSKMVAWMSFGMIFGMMFGLVLGIAMSNIALGIPLGTGMGLSVGLAVGSAMDRRDRRHARGFF